MTDEDPEDSGYKIHTLLLDMRVGTLGRATSGRGDLFLADLPLPSFKSRGGWLRVGSLSDKQHETHIRQLYISMNAPYLTPQILRNLCFSFLPGITAVPRKTENNAYAKF